MYLFKRFLVLLICLFIANISIAQVDIGGGMTISFPLSYNKNVGNYNHSLGSPGARLQFNYVPPDATFIPSVSFTYAQWLLPVIRFNVDKVLSMKFNTMSFTANAMIRKKIDDRREIRFGPGIGLATMNGRGVSVNGDPTYITRVIEDSSVYIKRVIPYIMLSVEYIFPMSSEVPLFIGLGGQVQYTYFFEGDVHYNMYVEDKAQVIYSLSPDLGGHMVNPAIYGLVYYRFGGRNR